MKKIIACLAALTIAFSAFAQKLPSVQYLGLRIPDNSKIDGKSGEWNDKFQAYNNSTEIFYTIANDENNLYIIIKATDQLVIRKIIAGSISFAIINDANNKSKDRISITYPIFDKGYLPNVNLKNKPLLRRDSTVNSKQVDSFMYVANRQIADKSKEMKILGSKKLQDSIFSVYNQEGIKVASCFDNKIAYTYELLVPFKYIGLSPTQKSFHYNIRLNGSDRAEGSSIENIPGGVRVNGNGSMEDMKFMWVATDFSGEYIFAKK